MSEIIEQAHAKINLTLDVLHRRTDGYHEVEMVMQSLELADTITIKKIDQGIVFKTYSPGIPTGEDNLAWRAARLMVDTFDHDGGLEIFLEKRIPVAAGLAGGSADAAAVIRGLNRLWKLNESDEHLCELGARLGSDIPFCIIEGTALAKGRGELLTQLAACPRFWVVLVKPPVGVSTAQVYSRYRQDQVLSRPDTLEIIEALREGNRYLIYSNLCNVLESVTFQLVPEVKKIKEELLGAGAVNALMSGSGPTVFGIAADENHAIGLAKVFEGLGYTVIVTRTHQ